MFCLKFVFVCIHVSLWGLRTNSEYVPVSFYFLFVGTCIVIYFYGKTNQMHNISIVFYFGATLHVSVGLSIHHQESKTVHTASYHTGSVAAC